MYVGKDRMDAMRETEEGCDNGWGSTSWSRDLSCVKHRLTQRVIVSRFHQAFGDLSPLHDRLDSNWCHACEAEQLVEDRHREQERAFRERVASCHKFLNAPARFAGASFENFHVSGKKQREALNAVRSYAMSFREVGGRCLVLSGSVGTGKTHLAIALGRSLADEGWYTRYVQAPDLIRDIKETWMRSSEKTERKVIEDYARHSLLIVDELGVGFNSETESRFFGEVIDARYRENRPTVIVTNLDSAGLRQVLGPRASDRIMERGSRAVIFDWPSFRRSPILSEARTPEPPSNPATLQ